MDEIRDVQAVKKRESEMQHVDDIEEQIVERPGNVKASEQNESFAKRIVFEGDGSEAIINFCENLSQDNPDEAKFVNRKPLQLVTIQQYQDSNSGDGKEGAHVSSLKFKVTGVTATQVDGKDEFASEITDPMSDSGKIDSKRFYLCFPCLLKFENDDEFIVHAREFHTINFEDNSITSRMRYTSGIIQESENGTTSICFLEPMPEDCNRDSTQRRLEVCPQQNQTPSLGLADIDTNSGDAVNGESLNSNEMKMNEIREDMRADSDSEMKPVPADRPSSNPGGNDSVTDSAHHSEMNTPETGELSIPNILPTGVEKAVKVTTVTSEASVKKSSLQHNNKGSTKIKESLFGAVGGVTNLDPLFHMSLFQSRNSCKTLKCPKCNWHYKYRQTLDAHMKEKHADETSDCIYCNTNQPHPRLSRGESYACGYKPFKCEVCNYSTTTKGNLSIHMQSDKHLYNVKSMQHQRQQQDKEKASGSTQTNNESNLTSRLTQDQFQNLRQQQNIKHNPTESSQIIKGVNDVTSSSTSNNNRRQLWRCDVCNYETDIPRNLRIHMQSEKHSHNIALAGASGERIGSHKSIKTEDNFEEDTSKSMSTSRMKESASLPHPNLDQSNPTLNALYYYLAAMQNPMHSQGNDIQGNSKEREKQFMAQQQQQQQQLLLAQQYQQMIAQFAGSTDAGSPAALIQQQLMLQQQMQLFRNLLTQADRPPNLLTKLSDADMALHDINNPLSTSDQFLFTCGICCNFSCNDLESFCTHVRAPRYSRNSLDESEWVTKSPTDGYLCRICNYTTQLKTNFSLHCKTEKHTSKLQLINHIREGGETNEWKVSYAIAGNNMNKVTCNGCQHSATSIDKLRIHCSTDRHQGTLTMCHYFDSMLKETELDKGTTTEETSSHRLSCRPCSYKSKFVVGMIQHMQSQSHQSKLREEQQEGSHTSEDSVTVELDVEDSNAGRNSALANAAEIKEETISKGASNKVEDLKVYRCKLCIFETDNDLKLQEHKATQHFSQSTIKCPMCPEYLSDTTLFQTHLIEVHRLTEQVESPQSSQPHIPPTSVPKKIEGTLQAIHFSCREQSESSRNQQGPSSMQEESRQDVQQRQLSRETDADDMSNQDNIDATEEKDNETNEDANMHEDSGNFNRAIFETPSELLRMLCHDAVLAANVMADSKFNETWARLEPPFTCSHCEETYLSKSDLLNHLRTSKAHGIGGVTTALHSQMNKATSPQSEGISRTTPCSRDFTHQQACSDFNEFDKGSNNEESNRERMDGSETQGISKSTQKAVLQEVGLDEVSHFVENKSNQNRENAKQWKKATTLSSDTTDPTSYHSSNTPRPFELMCSLCGKEFSNSWILKVHEKSVHNMEMSSEMLNEFIEGYTSWYWECLKKDAEGTNPHINSTESSSDSVGDDDLTIPPPSYDKPPKHEMQLSDSAPNTTHENDVRDFQNVAMQAFMKNYPGLIPHGHGMLPTSPRQNFSAVGDEQTRLQQQQMLLQCLMNAQAQAALQQQSILGGSNKAVNQTNSANIMNILMDQMYGAAMQGSNTPGFMDPMAVMALLQQQQQQQQQQSRIPGGNAVNQWLAMRYIQQQQQMQQLLMYPPGLGGGNSGLPFPPNLGDNNIQQQMLSAFAASMLGSGMSPDSLPGALMNNNPVANMLHAYQVQAAAAAAAASLPQSGKGADSDNAKLVRTQQPSSHSASNTQLTQSQNDIPAKRPRTRITDDQLKVLRSNFDINTSPGEDQVAEMALKTNLPPKVIKHWFRNTLFKERQRSKDSPYNFNIPPITSLDDCSMETQTTSVDSPKGGTPPSPDDHKVSLDLRSRKNSELDKNCDPIESDQRVEVGDLSHEMPSTNGGRNDALKFLQSFGCGSGKIAEAQQQFYSIPLAYMAANLGRTAKAESSPSLQLPSDVTMKSNSDEDFIETQNYPFGRSVSHASNEYLYSTTTSHSNMTSITRRTPRTRFSDYQLKVLQEFFDQNAYPKDEDLDRLSRVLELSTRVIVVWFQNARQKARKSYELQHGPMSQQSSSNNSNYNNFTRKRNYSSPQSPTIPNKSPVSLDLHAASKHFNMSRDSSSRTSDSMERATPIKCGKCDVSFQTLNALREHEKLHITTSSSSIVNPQHSKNDLSLALVNESGRASPTSSDKSQELAQRSPSEHKNAISQAQSFNEIISRFGMSEMMKYGKSNADFKSTTSVNSSQTSSPFISQSDFLAKQGLSSLHNHLSPGSIANAAGNRSIPGLKRKGINESNKDPKRLRTTITPEQLEFLYQQYLVDSSPSRKVIEQISDIVGLKKRVVQVWFQNTRARERKGQFRSVGRITGVLGMPQTCPHCRVTFRTKADLDAHVRYRHMQSPSAVAMSMGQSRQVSPGATFSAVASSSRDESHPSISQEKDVDYKELFNKNSRDEDLVSTSSKALSDRVDSYETTNGEPDEKCRKISNDSDHFKPLTSATAGIMSARTAEIYKAVTEQIFGNKNAINNLPRRGESAISPMNSTANHDAVGNSVSDYHAVSPQAVSSPESTGSSNPSFMVPLKRYRTQMTSLQVNALKHCFTEYKTPTLLECEILGDQIALPKRVIQVWFQNARAKDKKAARQGEAPAEQPQSPAKSACQLCPEVRFGSDQDYRNHIFSKYHLQNYITSVEGETQGSSKLSSEYESEDFSQKNSPNRSRSRSPSPPNAEAKYRVSAIATANGLPVPFTENQSQIPSTWSPTTLAKRYQQQFSVMHGLAAKAAEARNDDDNSQEQSQQQDAAVLQQFRQAWFQQLSLVATATSSNIFRPWQPPGVRSPPEPALLANTFRGDSASRPFEGVATSQTTTQAD